MRYRRAAPASIRAWCRSPSTDRQPGPSGQLHRGLGRRSRAGPRCVAQAVVGVHQGKLHGIAPIFAGGVPIALERYSLRPALNEMSCPARFGRFLYSSTMYICRAGENLAQWLALEDELNLLGRATSSDRAKWGASTLVSDGVVVRGMAQSAQQVNESLQAMWRRAKQRVWKRPAIAPRRIY